MVHARLPSNPGTPNETRHRQPGISTMSQRPAAAFSTTLVLFAGSVNALAQSEPSAFDTVYNVGVVPAGSAYDVPWAINALPPGNAIGSSTQFNVFEGADVPRLFESGPDDGSGANIEVNVFGGNVQRRFDAYAGTTMNISGGAVGLEFDAFAGSTVNLTGGSIDLGFDANENSTVNVSGGTIGDGFQAFDGSVINITGGTIGREFEANPGSTINISGGTIDREFEALQGSTINMTGGRVEPFFRVRSGSTLNWSGGSNGYLRILGGNLNVFGTEFFIDGVPLEGDSAYLGNDFTEYSLLSVLTGTLEDGTPFRLNPRDYNAGNVTLIVVPSPSAFGLLAVCGTLSLRRRR